jgi:tRNA-2-methylthio-N6-dimethylallyladenosine synthase
MTLKERQIEISDTRYNRFVGTTQKMLVEKPSKKDKNILTGRIEGGHIVHLESKENIIGNLVDVNIYDSSPFFLKATL